MADLRLLISFADCNDATAVAVSTVILIYNGLPVVGISSIEYFSGRVDQMDFNGQRVGAVIME